MKKEFLIDGQFSVPLRLASQKCGYKYVLLNKKDESTYEDIVEYKSRWGGIVNRCLEIETDYISENSKLVS